MKTKFIGIEIIVFIAIPYFIWNYGRDYTGDYYAMLLSTVPGFFYTIFRFSKDRQFNVGGFFILISLLIGTLVNLLSSSAIQMLWNSLWLGFAFTVVYLVSMIIRKPLALYFAVDFAYLQGFPRENSKHLYSIKENKKWFHLITAIFVMQGLVMNSIMALLIMHHGVEAFMHLILLRKALGLIFWILIFVGYLLTSKKVNEYTQKNDIDWPIKVDTLPREELEDAH